MRNIDNETLVMAFFEAMGPKVEDVAHAYERYFHPQGVWKNTGFPDMIGIDAIKSLLLEQQKLFDFQRVRVLDHRLLTSSGEHVFFERRDSIVNSRDEVVYAFDILGVFEIRDGKIVQWRDYMDTSAFKQDWVAKDPQGLGGKLN